MISIDARDLMRAAERLRRDYSSRVTEATAQALNDTAFAIARAEKAEIGSVFSNPRPWVSKNVRVYKATKAKQAATVGPTDWFGMGGYGVKSTPWDRVIAPHVYGGSRLAKASENRLRRAGILPAGWFTVPGEGAKLDRSGNISGGALVSLLSFVGGMGLYAGDNTNKRARQTKRISATERRGQAYFVARVGNRQRLAPGIYLRSNKTRTIKPMLMFVSRVSYRKRLDWYGIADRVARQTYPRALTSAFGSGR